MHAQVAPADVEFMRKYTSGYICVGMEGSALDRLRLPLMVSSAENEEAMYTAFTVTVDARQGVSTGISAADRAFTLRTLANPATRAADLRKPGHICPLRCSITPFPHPPSPEWLENMQSFSRPVPRQPCCRPAARTSVPHIVLSALELPGGTALFAVTLPGSCLRDEGGRRHGGSLAEPGRCCCCAGAAREVC
jgi:hypothetical protein